MKYQIEIDLENEPFCDEDGKFCPDSGRYAMAQALITLAAHVRIGGITDIPKIYDQNGNGIGEAKIIRESSSEKMTLSELKGKLPVGAKLSCVWTQARGREVQHFVVTGWSKRYIHFEKPGDESNRHILSWPKDEELSRTKNGFDLFNGGQLSSCYEWGHV